MILSASQVWFRTWPLTLPKVCLPPTPFIPEKHPSPFLPKLGPGRRWTAEDRRWGNYPSRSSLRGESWPSASHNRPRDTEGCLSGGPKASFKPSLSLWPTASLFSPPSPVALPARALLRSGMYMFHRPEQPLCGLGNLTKGCRAWSRGWGGVRDRILVLWSESEMVPLGHRLRVSVQCPLYGQGHGQPDLVRCKSLDCIKPASVTSCWVRAFPT